jgi:hypothetical protein
MIRTTLLTLAVLAAALAAGCGGDSGSGSGDGPAGLVPRDAALYVEATVRPEGDLREDALAAAGKVLDTSDPGPRLTELIQDALASGGDPKLDYARDIEAWLGETAGLWMSGGSQDGGPSGGADAEGLALVATTDADLTRERIGAALERGGKRYSRRSYEGVDYQVDGDGEVFAIVEEFAAFGTEAELKRTIDAAGGESLADSDAYRKSLEGLPDQRLAHFYADGGRFLTASFEDEPAMQEQAAQIERIFALKELGAFSGAVVADGDHLAFDSIADAGRSEAFRRLAFLGGGAATPLLKELPGDSWLAMGAPDLGETAKFFYGRAAGAFGGAAIAEQVRRETGLDLDQDVFGWIGDVAFFVRGDRVEALDGGAVIEVTDEGRAATAFGKLVGAARTRGGMSAEKLSLEGAEDAYALSDGQMPRPIVMARTPDRVVIALGREAAAAALSGSDTLGDSAAYAEAREMLGDFEPSLLVSWPQVAALVDAAGTADEEWAQVKPYLDAFTVMAGGGDSGDAGRLRSRFGVALR